MKEPLGSFMFMPLLSSPIISRKSIQIDQAQRFETIVISSSYSLFRTEALSDTADCVKYPLNLDTTP